MALAICFALLTAEAQAQGVSLSPSCRSNFDLSADSCKNEQSALQATAREIWGSDVAKNHPALVDYRVCKSFESCFAQDCAKTADQSDFKNASRPFVMYSQIQPAKGSVVLTHGLTDSPYSMGQIAENLRKHGYNVVSILLSNHGADHKDCDMSELQRWPSDVENGVALAHKLFGTNGKLCLGGYSTGGALTVDYEQSHPGTEIACNLLFDPALAIPHPIETRAEVDVGTALIDVGFKKLQVAKTPSGKPENSANPARTPYCDSDGISIFQTMSRVRKAANLDSSRGRRIDIPTFSVFSSGKSGIFTDPNALTVDSAAGKKALFGDGSPNTGIINVGDAIVHKDMNHLDVTIASGKNLGNCQVRERQQNGNPHLADDLNKMNQDMETWIGTESTHSHAPAPLTE